MKSTNGNAASPGGADGTNPVRVTTSATPINVTSLIRSHSWAVKRVARRLVEKHGIAESCRKATSRRERYVRTSEGVRRVTHPFLYVYWTEIARASARIIPQSELDRVISEMTHDEMRSA